MTLGYDIVPLRVTAVGVAVIVLLLDARATPRPTPESTAPTSGQETRAPPRPSTGLLQPAREATQPDLPRSARCHAVVSAVLRLRPADGSGRSTAAESVDDVEDVLLDAVAEHLAVHQLQFLGVLVGVAEQPLACAEEEWEDQEVVAVDQASVSQGVIEGDASVDDDRAALRLLDCGDLVQRTQDRGRPPVGHEAVVGEGG